MTTLFFMLLDYLEHLDYLVRLDLFYESTSSVVCLSIADYHKLAINDSLADVGIVRLNILNCCGSSIVVQDH